MHQNLTGGPNLENKSNLHVLTWYTYVVHVNIACLQQTRQMTDSCFELIGSHQCRVCTRCSGIHAAKTIHLSACGWYLLSQQWQMRCPVQKPTHCVKDTCTQVGQSKLSKRRTAVSSRLARRYTCTHTCTIVYSNILLYTFGVVDQVVHLWCYTAVRIQFFPHFMVLLN